jgi:GMP synthase (glutamine-hydrolysing)
MATPRNKLRLVLLQVRNHQSSMKQEQECFLDRCRVERNQLRCFNLVERPRLSSGEVNGADAVLIGGAGDYSVTQDHPFSQPLADLALELVDDGYPFFAACWGHQFLAQCFGSKVIHDPESAEIGTFNVTLTPQGLADPLLGHLPPVFPVQLAHQDRVSELGPDWDTLAFSAVCPNQIIRLRDKPVYGTQFHSEMNEDRLRERIQIYLENYLPDPQEYERVCQNLRPSREADGLIGRFLELYA